MISTRSLPKQWLLCQFVVCLIAFADVVQSSAVEEKLMRNLFIHYDRSIRPAQPGHTITFNLTFKVNHLEFDESKGLVTVSSHLIGEWIDPKLNWKMSDYENVSKLHLTGHEIWLPDISLYNSIGNKALDISDSGVIWLDHTGLVVWSMKVRLQILCEMDLFRWPYDTHMCKVIFGSWTFDGLLLDLFPTDKAPTIVKFTENPEFHVTNISSIRQTQYYNCCAEPYVTLEYSIEFARRSSAYAWVFLVPAYCVVIMTLSAFWVPPHRGEKVLLNGITLIVITMYIMYFIENLSSFSLRMPLIAIFYSFSFVLVTFSTIISVLVLASARSLCKGHLPPGLTKILKSRVGVLFGPTNDSKKPDQTELNHHFEDGKTHETHSLIRVNSSYDDWTSLGIILDRVCFVAYSGIFLLIGIACYL